MTLTTIPVEPRIIVLERAWVAISRAFRPHRPAPPQYVGKVAQGLGEIAAGLALHAQGDDKEAEFRRVDVLADLPQQAFEIATEPHARFDGAEFGADRITDLMPGHERGFLACELHRRGAGGDQGFSS
jgi:hypothetical protein